MDDTFPKLLASSPTRFGANKVAFREKNLGIWRQSTWQEYADRVRLAAAGLSDLGFQRGDRLALMGSNKRELFVLALAALSLGGTIVGIYQDETPRELLAALTETQPTLAVAEDQEQVDKLLQVKDQIPLLRRIIFYELRGMEYYDDPLLLPLDRLLESASSGPRDIFDAAIATGSENDPAVIVYTSGQVGNPRPVVLSHRNLLKLCEAWRSIDTFRPTDEYVSFVSPAIITELIVVLGMHLTTGFIVNFPESDETILQDLREIGPHIVVAPPRFWETIVGNMRLKAVETSNLKKAIVQSNLPAAERGAEARLKRGGPPAKPGGLGNFLVFRPMRDSVGLLRTRLAYNVGGPVSPEVVTTLHAIGVPLRQIYGLSEAGGMVTMHRPDDIRLETAGPPLPDVEVRVDDNGEILLRGPSIFASYYENAALTADVLRDGWLRTGDAGYLTDDNQLVVIDRLAAVLNLPDGNQYSAQAIESRLKLSPYIAEAVVIGQDRPYVAAIIAIDPAVVGKWAEAHSIAFAGMADLSQLEPVYELVRAEVERVNAGLPEAVQIRRYVLLHRPFSADEGELTRTMKVRRGAIARQHGSLIEALYGKAAEATIPTETRFADGRVVQSETAVRVASLSPEFAEVRQ